MCCTSNSVNVSQIYLFLLLNKYLIFPISMKSKWYKNNMFSEHVFGKKVYEVFIKMVIDHILCSKFYISKSNEN